MHTYTITNMHPHAIVGPSPNSSPTACSLSTDRYANEGEQAIERNSGAGRTEGKEILETQIKRRGGRMGEGNRGFRGKGRGNPHTAFFWLLRSS